MGTEPASPLPRDESHRTGMVHLVGAGPGDPGLLTVRAQELLRTADVVAYDALVSPSILACIGPQAERLSVGRRHGIGATAYRLHPLVLERAKAGRTVVRLKAGDPMIFGRGGEEAEELAEAGIPFSIVPGISAALGAAACAGIPLTHRHYASEVTFLSGHHAEGRQSHFQGSKAAGGSGTLVLFMVAKTLSSRLQQLIQAGHSAETPAAYIAAATTSDQRVIIGTLATLPEKVRAIDPAVPALVIVGDVVGLRERMARLMPHPLEGRRLLVARARPGWSAIADALRERGADVLEIPDIEAVSLNGEAEISSALGRLREFHGIVFGCAAGVEAVLSAVPTLDLPIIAVGAVAAQALSRRGIAATVFLRGACREAIHEQADWFLRRRLLLVTGTDGRPNLQAELTNAGAEVEPVAAYRHVHRMPNFHLPVIDLVVLPSSSAARYVLAGDIGMALAYVPMAAIGQCTARAARESGARSVRVSETDTVDSLVSLVVSMSVGSS